MKVENHIKRILGRDDLSVEVKRLKLFGLALRCVPQSPNQQKVSEAIKQLKGAA